MRLAATILISMLLFPAAVQAQKAQAQGAAPGQIFTYPAAGQSPEQQQRDRFECHSWSVQQSGYDPSSQQAAPAQPQAAQAKPEQHGPGLRGKIAEKKEEAADKKKQEMMAQQKQQAMQQQAAKYDGYKRAFSACMESRHYTVK